MGGENMGREDYYLYTTTIKVAQIGGDQTK